MRNWIFVVLVLAVLCVVPTVTNAQSVASVTGTVTDSTGATIPGATITLVDTRTNNSYFGKTSGDGTYRISDVPPGPGYSLTVKKDGFQVFVVNALYLPVATATTQDIKLELGTVSQKVEVTAEGSVSLNTTDATIGNNLDTYAIAALPNEFRDNPANLLRLEPGVVSAITPAGGPATGTGSIDPNLTRDGAVAGARTDQSNIIVDGIDQSNISSGFAFTLTGDDSRGRHSGIQYDHRQSRGAIWRPQRIADLDYHQERIERLARRRVRIQSYRRDRSQYVLQQPIRQSVGSL